MTERIRWHRYTDHTGRTISVRAVQNPSGEWEEKWEIAQLMRADLSREPDTQERRPVAYRTASESFDGSQPHLNTSTAPRATKNNSNREGAKHG